MKSKNTPIWIWNPNGGSATPHLDFEIQMGGRHPPLWIWGSSQIHVQGLAPGIWIPKSKPKGTAHGFGFPNPAGKDGGAKESQGWYHLSIYIVIRVRSYSGVDMLQGFEDMLQDLTCCAFATKHSHMGGCLIYPSLEAQPRPCGLAQAQPHTITIPPSPPPSQHIISTSHLFLPSILVVVSSIPHNT